MTNTIVNSTSDLIWSVDHEQFRFLTFNTGLEEFFLRRGVHLQKGMRPEDVCGGNQDLANQWHELYRRTLAEGSFTTDYASSGAGFMQMTLNLLRGDGKVFGISVFSKDITVRKRAEEALQRSEDRYRSLAQATTQVVWTSNPMDIPVEDQPSWREFTGQSLSEIKSSGWLEVLHPGDRDQVGEKWANAMGTASL